jgi:CBS domain-containing protein
MDSDQARQRLADERERLVGVARHQDLLPGDCATSPSLGDAMERNPVVAHPHVPLRVVAYRMAESGRTRLPVVERGDHRRVVGMIALRDMLEARRRNLEAEKRRERFLKFPRARVRMRRSA